LELWEGLEVSPAVLKAGEVGFVTFELQSPMCVDAAVDVPAVRPFCVRDDERLAAVVCVWNVVTSGSNSMFI
jgi:translation elongation factor EF-1alpha